MKTTSTLIAHKLSVPLGQQLKKADELWVAVGLLNKGGLDFILKKIPAKCKVHFIVGVNLPSEPRALTELVKQKIKRKGTAKVLTEKFFHPKVYIVRTANSYRAFVGSANCTNGGFDNNIEMSLDTSDKAVCASLIGW